MVRAGLYLVVILALIFVVVQGFLGRWGESPVPLVLCVVAFFVLLRFINPYRSHLPPHQTT